MSDINKHDNKLIIFNSTGNNNIIFLNLIENYYLIEKEFLLYVNYYDKNHYLNVVFDTKEELIDVYNKINKYFINTIITENQIHI